MSEDRATIILNVLKQTLTLPSWVKSKRDPFKTLIITILSQNTADSNAAKAYENLSKHFEIIPEALAKGSLGELKEAIKVAGLYNSKAMTIKKASSIIIEKYNRTLKPILSLPLEEARKALMQFPGVGPKTADVVLLFSSTQKTIPIDTHVNRLAKRLCLASAKGNYESVRCSLQALFDPSEYLNVHLLFIAHGRKTCKSLHPLCKQCTINLYCPSNGLWDKQ